MTNEKFKKIVIFSGAGIDAPSGVPTFRDSNGLWENHKVEEVCDIFTWKNNYELVHKFYDDRRAQLKTVFPNIAHSLVSYWQKKYTCLNVTTNISDLFERAGVIDTVHLHGYLPEVYCTECGTKYNLGYDRSYYNNISHVVDGDTVTTVEQRTLNQKLTNHKSGCAWHGRNKTNLENTDLVNIFKPNVVFFGEEAPEYRKLYSIVDACDKETVAIVVGASNIVVDFVGMLSTRPSKLIIVDKNENLLDNIETYDATFINKSADDGFIDVNSILTDIME